MNDLNIVVEVKASEVSTNFEDVKAGLAEQMEVYKELAVTEEVKAERKKDIATLRKMQKAVKEEDSKVKKACLAPYELFREKANELVQIIEDPIAIINSQVKEFEEKQRLQKRADIESYFSDVIKRYSLDMQEEVGLASIYDGRWENATASMKSVKEEIDSKLKTISDNVNLIKSMVSDKTEEALNLFWGDLDVAKAIGMINRYEAQKREIQAKLDEEKRIAEEQEREKERERIRKEEREKLLEEQKRNIETANQIEKAKVEAQEEIIESLTPHFNDDSTSFMYIILLNADGKAKLEMFMDSVGIEWKQI